MPSIKRSLKIARLAVQHLGPPLVRGIFGLAGGVVTNMAANAGRHWADGDWLIKTAEDYTANREPGDDHFGTHFLPERDDPRHPNYWHRDF